jgi:hypothetical protein
MLSGAVLSSAFFVILSLMLLFLDRSTASEKGVGTVSPLVPLAMVAALYALGFFVVYLNTKRLLQCS